VLVIDGSIEQSESFYLSAAFSPGSRANTGVRPQLEPASYLDEVKPERLAQFTSIYLLDVPRLNDAGVRNLEHFVRQGGGLCVFAGPNLNLDFYNQQLYRDGSGPMPLPLAGDDLLAAEATDNNPDIRLEDHPIFQVLQAERNPLIRMVSVQRYLKPPDNWSPPDDSTVAVIATLRNLQPLVVERQFGQGRVVAVLTSLSPTWNNWARNPSFVVALLRIQAYLASTARDQDDRRVGTPLEVQLDAQRFRKDAVFVAPGPVNVPRVAIESTALQESAQSALMSASIGRRPRTRLQPGDTDRSGVYEFWPLSNEGQFAIERWAFNVNEKEGDLATVGRQQLVQLLDPVAVTIRHVDEYQYESGQSTGFNRSLLLMCLLIPLLLGEQILAYFASYHPPRGSVA
jgi:hypothetical protein